MRALWIDPGETFGWAISTVKGKQLKLVDYGNEAAQPFLMRLAKTAVDFELIGFETYTVRADKFEAHAGSDVPTLQFVGGIRLAGWLAQAERKDGFPRIVDQSPNAKKKGLGVARALLRGTVDLANIEDALSGLHDDGHYGDALLHTMAWFKTEILDGRPLEAL
jgi:hypothetical protein